MNKKKRGYFGLSRKEQRKLLNRILNNVDKANERLVNRLNLNDPRLIEHYLAGELDICFHFSSFGLSEEGARVKMCDHIAYIENPKFVVSDFSIETKLLRGFKNSRGMLNKELGAQSAHRSGCDDGESMFVLYGELVESPEIGPLPTRITFQPFDDFENSRPRLLYFSFFEESYKILGAISNWEIRPALDAIIGGEAESNNSTEEMIERGAKVVNDVTYNNGKLRRRISATLYDYFYDSGLTIILKAENIRITVNKPLSSDIKLVDVLLGPFNFRPDTGEVGVRCYHSDTMSPKKPTKQKTQKGFEIPVPSKNDFFDDLEKAAFVWHACTGGIEVYIRSNNSPGKLSVEIWREFNHSNNPDIALSVRV